MSNHPTLSKNEIKLQTGASVSVQSLSDEQKKVILERAQRMMISTATNAVDNAIKQGVSSAEMDVTVNAANRLEGLNCQYSVSSDHRTASGTTSILVDRQRKGCALGMIFMLTAALFLCAVMIAGSLTNQ